MKLRQAMTKYRLTLKPSAEKEETHVTKTALILADEISWCNPPALYIGSHEAWKERECYSLVPLGLLYAGLITDAFYFRVVWINIRSFIDSPNC